MKYLLAISVAFLFALPVSAQETQEPTGSRAQRPLEGAGVNTGRSSDRRGAKLQARGRYAEAEASFTRALNLKERALGPDHPAVAVSLDNLANLYLEQRQQDPRIEPHYLRALEVRVKALGLEHWDVALSLNYLTALYKAQGRDAEADGLQMRAQKIWDKAQEPDPVEAPTTLVKATTIPAPAPSTEPALPTPPAPPVAPPTPRSPSVTHREVPLDPASEQCMSAYNGDKVQLARCLVDTLSDVSERLPTILGMAREFRQIEDFDTALDILNIGFMAAKNNPELNQPDRDAIFAKLGWRFAKNHDFRTAVQTLTLITDESEKTSAAESVIYAMVESGEYPLASNVASIIDDVKNRDRAYRQIAVAQAEVNQGRAALETCKRIRRISYRNDTLIKVSLKLVEVGNIPAARGTLARSIDNEDDRNEVRASIAEAQYGAGDKTSAEQTIRTISKRNIRTDEYIARGLAKYGARSDALTIAVSIAKMNADRGAPLLMAIAEEMRKANDPAKAKETYLLALDSLKIGVDDDFWRALLLADLAAAAQTLRDSSLNEVILNAATNQEDRDNILHEIVEALTGMADEKREGGQPAIAKTTWFAAVNYLKQMEARVKRAVRLDALARVAIELNDTSVNKALLDAATTQRERDTVREVFASALMDSGEFVQAQAVIGRIVEADVLQTRFAIRLMKEDMPEEALAAAHEIQSPPSRATALFFITAAAP